MTVIVLEDGTRFVPQKWHDATINTIPEHNDALVTCRACQARRLMPDGQIRTQATSQMRICQLAARLRCTSCGAKDAELLFGYIAGDPPPL